MSNPAPLKIADIVNKYIPEKHHNQRLSLLKDLYVLVLDADEETYEHIYECYRSTPMWRRVYNAFLNRF